MSKESMQQLPGSVYGVAYEDAMGGVSVDLCLDHDGDTDPTHLLERHQDSELVCVVPEYECSMALIKAAPTLLKACEDMIKNVEEWRKHWNEYDNPTTGKLYGLSVCLNNRTGDIMKQAVAEARGE